MATGKIRKMFFIDGFNLYHSIERIIKTDKQFIDCKWLDLEKICKRYIDVAYEEFAGIKYFTALSWKSTSLPKQKIYIDALLAHSSNIEIVYGKFKARTKKCPLCNQQYIGHEEKLTDVNLAIHLFENALKNTFDEAVIISADSDLIPPITAIKRLFAEKCIAILPPYNNSAQDLINNAHKKYKMKSDTLLNSQLPQSFSIFTKPPQWESKNYIFNKTTNKLEYIL